MENIDAQNNEENLFGNPDFYQDTADQISELDEESTYKIGETEVSGKDLKDALSKADQSANVIDSLQKKQAELEMMLSQMQSYQEGQQSNSQQQQQAPTTEAEPVQSKVVQFFENAGDDSAENYISGNQLREVTQALVEDFTSAMQSSLRDPDIMRTAIDHRLQELGQEDQSNQQVVGKVNKAYQDFIDTKVAQTSKSKDVLDSIYKPALERVHRDRAYMLEGNDPATVLRGALDEVDRVIDNYDSAQNQPVEVNTGVEKQSGSSLDVGRRFRTKLPETRKKYFSQDEARDAFRQGVERANELGGTFG